MSWSISIAAKGKSAAKAQLADKAAAAGNVPDAVVAMAMSAIDALPETGMAGYETVTLATYGHFRGDSPGTSNFTLAAQYVSDGPEA